MNILGLVVGHDASAAVVSDGKIVSAINEERLSRIKKDVGFPYKAIKETLKISNLEGADIDVVTVASTDSQYFPKHLALAFFDKKTTGSAMRLLHTVYRKINPRGAGAYFRGRLRDELGKFGVKSGIHYLDHHLSHAASAYYTSGFTDPLIVTIDGAGDNLCSSVNIVEDGRLHRISSTYYINSPGYFYSRITTHLGFKPLRHEGKITGLAAFGDPERYYDRMKELLSLSEDKRRFYSPRFSEVEEHKLKYMLLVLKNIASGKLDDTSWRGLGMDLMLKEVLSGCDSDKDIASAAQRRLEDVIVEFVRTHVRDTGKKEIALAGGVFGNVRVNQKIGEIEGVSEVFIHPAMGDEGLAVGSALLYYENYLKTQGKTLEPRRLENVFFGPSFTDDELKEAFKGRGYEPRFVDGVEKFIAESVASGRIVGWFNGRMEYGPRALGDRSIIADPRDRAINDWLNERLKRTEFMPFAPSILAEALPKVYKKYKYGLYTAEFMTITYDTYSEWIEKAPAVAHVDGTARPQIVTKKSNPRFYRIIEEFEKITGLPLVINTSFNMHEEPIVCTPSDAIRAFEKGSVDVLALSNWVIESEKPKEEYRIEEEGEISYVKSDTGVY